MLEVKNGGFQLRGADRMVEIDELVLTKRKYHKERQIPEQWIFSK